LTFHHHDLEFEVPDQWWDAAGMAGFVPDRQAYRYDSAAYPNAFEVAIADIEPLYNRRVSHGMFNDNPENGGTAEFRVTRIFEGFRTGAALPPVNIERAPGSESRQFVMKHGAHRLYASIAVGFTHIPVQIASQHGLS